MRWMGAFLLLPLALPAQAGPDESCSISGQVTNAITGEPVRRALVYMRRIDSSPGVTNVQVTQSGTTDGAGRFALSGIAPGKYRLLAERSGFIPTQYGSRRPNSAGTLLTLEPGQKSSDMTMRLTPHGVIAGRVLDEDGEPVLNANVQVLRQQYMQGRKQLSRTGGGNTNDLGEYRIYGLPPGRYFVSAEIRPNPIEPQAADEYVTTYFPRSTDAAAAAPIDMAPGAQLRNIDVALAKMHTVAVTGRAVSEIRPSGSGDNTQRTYLNVMLSARNKMMVGSGFTRGAPVNPQGIFEFRGVTPGSYFVIAQVNLAGKNFAARTAIQVGSSNIEGISLTVRGGVPVTGRVRVEGETTAGLSGLRVMLQPAEAGGVVFGPFPSQQVKEDGGFQLDEVGADRYSLSLNGLPEGFYLKSARSANIDVLADGLEIAAGSPAPLDIVVSSRAGQVSGTVLDPRTQKAAAGMTVVLVPQEKERRIRESFYRSATTDAAGGFTFKSLTPGEYRVYSWEEAEFGAWMDPEFLRPQESRGEPVSIQEGARQAVQVNLIPADSQ